MGAARGIDALGLQSNAMLMSNGVEGALRVNVPVVMRRAQLLEPFGFVGVGWSALSGDEHQHVNTSDLARDDDVMTRAGRRRARVRDRPLHGGRALHLPRDLLQRSDARRAAT